MARLPDVNPNRMELMRIKRRLAVAQRGHRLLKDKLDELLKPFLSMAREIPEKRVRLEEELVEAERLFALAGSGMSRTELEQAVAHPTARTVVTARLSTVVSLEAPDLEVKVEGGVDSYGLAMTPALLDDSLNRLKELLPELADLAREEKIVGLLAGEIEKTRRRVNALEYILIPQLEQTARYITMKLEEHERGNLTRLLKIKEMTS